MPSVDLSHVSHVAERVRPPACDVVGLAAVVDSSIPSFRPSVSVLIVTYQSAGFIRQCLQSLARCQLAGGIEVIVVDNGSEDGTVQLIRSEFPAVRLVVAGENLGFAGANNRAMAAAQGVRLLILNPDTIVPKMALERLVGTLDADPGIGVVAPRLINPDGTDQQTARSFPTPAAAVFGRRSPITRLWPDNPWSMRYLGRQNEGTETPFVVDWVSGACFLIRRDVALASGGFDERFFLYWEDADWCRRINRVGLRVVCDPGVTVQHDEGARRHPSGRQVRAFHHSAYLYFAKHELRGPRFVLRPVARAVLGGRAVLTLALRWRPTSPLRTPRRPAEPMPAQP
jgi:N-acetylglucosaminyl-diphospho-decaprenol L-rhamnosyltransferase